MLKYDRIDVLEGIDTIKTDASHECVICHYWHSLRINFLISTKSMWWLFWWHCDCYCEKNNYIKLTFPFAFMTQISFHDSNKAVDKFKMLISVKKKWTATITKKLFMIVMLNNTPKTMTEQERYRGRNREKCLEKGRRYYAEIKERLQKICPRPIQGTIWRRKKQEKENTEKIDAIICLEKSNKN